MSPMSPPSMSVFRVPWRPTTHSELPIRPIDSRRSPPVCSRLHSVHPWVHNPPHLPPHVGGDVERPVGSLGDPDGTLDHGEWFAS